jgi:hypothetical protein
MHPLAADDREPARLGRSSIIACSFMLASLRLPAIAAGAPSSRIA